MNYTFWYRIQEYGTPEFRTSLTDQPPEEGFIQLQADVFRAYVDALINGEIAYIDENGDLVIENQL